MMKRRLLPLLLVLLFLLSACSSAAARVEEEVAATRALESGTYALYDENNELSGYLQVSAGRLIRYDAEGNETERVSYRYSTRDDIYTDENGQEFTVSNRKRGLVLRRGDERFTLSKAELPGEAGTGPASSGGNTGELSAEDIYQLALSASVDVVAYLADSYYATGSGFFYDTTGTVITNYHVIEDAYEASITTSDGKEYAVTRVLAWDKDRDIAMLATECPKSIALPRRAEAARPGETVYAFGSPLGFSATISDGIVSNAAREYDGQIYIQHTAPISHGNSGGPLLDSSGNVLGIVCAYFSGGQNLNLAIPVADIESLDRGAGTTLTELFSSGSGGGGTTVTGHDPVWDADWYSMCVASDLGWDLYADLPELMADALEINDDYTGISTRLDGDAGYYLYFSADLLSLDGASVSDLDYGELSDMISETMEELTSDYTVTSTTAVISGLEWIVFLANGSVEGMPISDYLLLTPTPDERGMFMVNALTFAQNQTDFDEGEDIALEILVSLSVQRSD